MDYNLVEEYHIFVNVTTWRMFGFNIYSHLTVYLPNIILLTTDWKDSRDQFDLKSFTTD